MWQAEWAASSLRAAHPGLEVEIVPVESHGDIDLSTPLSQLGTVGVFTQTLERELERNTIDVAIHSLKDVPAQLASGLTLAAFSPREDPRDAWFHREDVPLEEAPEGTRVATGSLRRRCQLLSRWPHLTVVELRGNLQTRWRRFEQGSFDAMVLAAAGVKRLDWADRVTEFVDPEILMPAVGQGIIGLEVRAGDPAEALVAAIDNANAHVRATAERSLLAEVAGGCIVPLAGFCVIEEDQLILRARLGTPDGQTLLQAQGRAPRADALALGRRVGQDLHQQGGRDIVRRAKEMRPS
jgi:hydroxymethylbilane synthase